MSDKEIRHYCCKCNGRKYEKYMIKIRYPLINRGAWSCKSCYKEVMDRYKSLYFIMSS